MSRSSRSSGPRSRSVSILSSRDRDWEVRGSRTPSRTQTNLLPEPRVDGLSDSVPTLHGELQRFVATSPVYEYVRDHYASLSPSDLLIQLAADGFAGRDSNRPVPLTPISLLCASTPTIFTPATSTTRTTTAAAAAPAPEPITVSRAGGTTAAATAATIVACDPTRVTEIEARLRIAEDQWAREKATWEVEKAREKAASELERATAEAQWVETKREWERKLDDMTRQEQACRKREVASRLSELDCKSKARALQAAEAELKSLQMRLREQAIQKESAGVARSLIERAKAAFRGQEQKRTLSSEEKLVADAISEARTAAEAECKIRQAEMGKECEARIEEARRSVQSLLESSSQAALVERNALEKKWAEAKVESDREILRLQQRVVEEEQKRMAAESRIGVLNRSLAQSQSESSATIELLSDKIRFLEPRLDESRATAVACRSESMMYQRELVASQDVVRSEREKYALLESRRAEEANKWAAEKSRLIAEYNGQLTALRSDIDKGKREAEAALERCKAQERSLASAAEAKAKARSRAAEVEEEEEWKEAEKESEKAIENRVSKLLDQVASAEKTVTELRKESVASQALVQSLRSEITRRVAESKFLQDQVLESKTKVASLESELASTRAFTESVPELRQQVAEWRSKWDAAQEKVRQAQAEMTRIDADHRKVVSGYEGQLRQLRKDVSDWQKRFDDQKLTIEDQARTTTLTKATCDKLRQRVLEAETQQESLRQLYDQSQDAYRSISVDLERQRNDFESRAQAWEKERAEINANLQYLAGLASKWKDASAADDEVEKVEPAKLIQAADLVMDDIIKWNAKVSS